MITRKGRELARNLSGVIGKPTPEAEEACSRMIRLAPAYDRIQERYCSEEMSEATTRRLEREEARLEAAIRRHFEELPRWRRLRLHFGGDPRGYTVKITTANPADRGKLRGTDWGGEDVGVGPW